MAAPKCPRSRALLNLAHDIKANGAPVVSPTDKLVFKRLKRAGLVRLSIERVGSMRYPRMRLTLLGQLCVRKRRW